MKSRVASIMLALAVAALSVAPVTAATSKARAVARLFARDGAPAGTATFVATAHGVLIEFDLKGLTAGPHAIHVHTSGNCDTKTAFTSAGPDLGSGPTKLHGYLMSHGPHPGDLPNQFAAGDGTLHASVISNMISLGNGKKSIFDRDGAAIIVHAKADDYVSQPSGNSGDRIACGVIGRTVSPAPRKGDRRKAHS